MMVDQPDDLEAVRHDQGLGKVFPHQRAVTGSQIHTDHTNQTLSF